MHGLVRTAAIVLASSVVSSALPFSGSNDGDNTLPQAFIDLDVTKVVEDVLIPRTLLAFEVSEADTSCGHSNVTLDGNSLDEDEDGMGAGTIVTKHGTRVDAEWRYSCVQVDDRQHFERILTFNIIDIDGYQIQGLNFTVQFQQLAPTGVSLVDGAFSVIRVPTTTAGRLAPGTPRNKPFSLQSEMYELEILNARLARLEFEIAAKEFFIAKSFPKSTFASPQSLSDCTNIKCFVITLYDTFKTYLSGAHRDGFHRDQNGMIIVPPNVPEADVSDVAAEGTPEKHAPPVQDEETMMYPIIGASVQQVQSPIVLTSASDSVSNEAPYPEQPTHKQDHAWRLSTASLTASPLKTSAAVGSSLLLLVAVIFAIRAACTEKARERRRARRAARKEWREKREARLRAIKAIFANICSWLHERTSRKRAAGNDVEKEAAARDVAGQAHQGHEEHHVDSSRLSWVAPTTEHAAECSTSHREPESDEESTTMEQDLAHFRAVAGLVENLFAFTTTSSNTPAASDGNTTTNTTNANNNSNGTIMSRLRGGVAASRLTWALRRSSLPSYSDPPSPTSTVPDYSSSDETLPSYESSTNSFVGWD
ncbi:uncharacterized protein B0I36DRAFT_360782 [Microdochium trichocladiopsis]|uniref:Uncharacterized protein n=1 Tax=Microdochium trichocladiopsis TaxID=1682393 RepID=A0A9P8YBM4_9PEZI|nr:uncharacterized protein B0I36DRAFT_360782 [Microdochium trichocladiopsis]KAH7035406.1 hypothetical protein B0I36DRAFT_360782 [Microdochium trichocladiopsis]